MNDPSEQSQRSLTGLALSGGGFRATLFGLGSLCRLNDLGLLRKIDRITSVSGGSIVSAYLGFRWRDLTFDASGVATNFDEVVARPVRRFCALHVDAPAILKGLVTPFRSIGDFVASRYDTELFRKRDGSSATLQDLPADGEGPRFILCATSLQTRACVRFSRPYIADFNLGMLPDPTVRLAVAVGASSAFPPVLSPVRLKTNPDAWVNPPKDPPRDLRRLRSRLLLTDGGVYDNIGLEPLWQKDVGSPPRVETLLVSDAGGPADIQLSPWRNWLGQLGRVRGIMMEQTRALRRRMVVDELTAKRLSGAFWGISTSINAYPLADALIADSDVTRALRHMRTRLNPFNEREQCELINWGYALCDAALRAHVQPGVRPPRWPAQGPYAFAIKPIPASL